nr:MAG TPA: transposase DDE domain protein [Caudoviricetes sp.]
MRKYDYSALADAADALNDATEDCRECPVRGKCNCDEHGCLLDTISEILRDNACLADAYQAAA